MTARNELPGNVDTSASTDAPKTIFEFIGHLERSSVPKTDYSRHIATFVEMNARRRAIPLHGNFELTASCNLDCKMCYVHLDGHKTKDDLSPATWKGLITQAHQMGMMQASLTGGECLTYPGFDEIYLFLRHMGIKPAVLTNGVLIDQRRVEFFRQNPPRIVQISLYGSSEEAYRQVTGHRTYRRVRQALVMLRDAGVPVRITITPNEYMQHDIHALIEDAQSLGITFNINSILIPPRQDTGRDLHDVPPHTYLDIYRTQSELEGSALEPLDMAELPDEGRGASERRGLKCGGGRSSFGITHDGKLCPCLSFAELGEDVLKLGFTEAWKRVNKRATDYLLPVECGTCAYEERCLHCAASHKNAKQQGHCDRRVCERTKLLVGAGLLQLS